ncbi:MAG TPA: serine hydrolase domain-containing protein [Terriglobales bacterium]|nr:serine hydrolase domain-containing protein [Terriglobales bacterium]
MPRHRPTRRRVLQLLGGTLFTVPIRLFGSTSASAALTARLRQFIDTRQIAGMVALISRAGRHAYLEAIGWQDLERHLPMRTSTIFDMRSMTKEVTATALMCLVEDGRVHLDDAVSTYLPEFASLKVAVPGQPPRPPSRAVTLFDVLTETSGMAQDRPAAIANITRVLARPLPEVVKLVAAQPLIADPGAPWLYSSMGYAVLGRVIEVTSGQSYEHFVADRIFRPLDMRDSFFFPPREKWPRIAAMYNLETAPLHRDVLDIYRKGAKYSAPEFGMFSTVRDIERFFRMTMNGGMLDGHRILQSATVRTMLQPRVPTSIDGISQGLAWFICTDPSKQNELRISTGSFGAAGASGTFGWIDPDRQMIRLLLMQRFGGTDAERNAFMHLAADVS